MPVNHHSATAHAAYHDLLRLLMDDRVSDLRGTPTQISRGARVYWYDSYRIGNEVRKTYIGEDSPALRERIQRHSPCGKRAKRGPPSAQGSSAY